MKNEWISLLGNIPPVKVGKTLLLVAFMLVVSLVNAQKVVTINTVKDGIVVEQAATFEQVTAKMTKQTFVFPYNGKNEPVYSTKQGTCYAIITTTNGIIKKRLKMQI